MLQQKLSNPLKGPQIHLDTKANTIQHKVLDTIYHILVLTKYQNNVSTTIGYLKYNKYTLK